MSGIGGIHSFNCEPIDLNLLAALSERLVYLGPDGGRSERKPSIDMVYRAFHTTPESRLEKQPYVSDREDLLCFDGRLDNRRELIAALQHELTGDDSDVALVMLAYLRWGMDFLQHLIGDFVLSLWDSRAQTLLLARDVAGVRDLYYHMSFERVMWSSDLAALLDLCGVELEIDDDYVAAHLARLAESGQTPFKHIKAVAAAHVVTIKQGRAESTRYWGLNLENRIRYKSDAEYEEHFRYLFREAVQCRLRSQTPIWCDLSGGLDSSSIACMAHQLIESGDVSDLQLETVSYIHDEAPTSTELKFISYVEERIGRAGHHILESECPIFSQTDFRSSIVPNTLDIFRSYYNELNRLMSDANARVRLCGNGGDEILNSLPNPAADLMDSLVQGHFLELHRGLKTWSQDRKQPYLKLFWDEAFVPLLPRRLQVGLKHGPVKRLPGWLESEFVRSTGFADRLLGPKDVFGFHRPSDRLQAISFLCAVRELSGGFMRLLQNVEIRMPFLHRPLVEFMQAIPKEQRARPGETRSLQRRALRDLVPPEILRRKGKGNPIEALSRAIVREHNNLELLMTNTCAAQYGYVNQQRVNSAVEKLKYGDMQSLEIFRLIPLESWLRLVEQKRTHVQVTVATTGLPEAMPVATC
jgi:asparagine synthase (glutamine-hydrolysing)